MLEIKPFDAWAEANATTDPSEKIKQYADYVRTNAFKNGQLDENSELEIQQGVYDRAVVDGLILEDEPEEDRNLKMQGLLTPTQNKDADAKFLLDHYQQDFEPNSPEYAEKAPTIQKYFALKQVSPEQVGELQTIIDGYVGDKNEVKNARLSAVDRGDYRVISVEEEGGRQLYSGADTMPENLKGELDSLLSNGAITPSDLRGVKQLTDPINGGISTVAEGTRYSVFANTLNSLAKKDPTLRSSIDQESARLREAKREAQMTTGESIFENIKEVVAIPIDALAGVVSDAFGLAHPEEKAAAPIELIGSNKALTSRFSETEVNKFLGDYLKNTSGPVYRADRPETGIEVDSMGTPIVSPALIGNKAQFEKALSLAPLNEDQKERATIGRMATLKTEAPKLLKLILGESSEAASSFAQAKASGKTDAQFVEEWVGNNTQNYDGMSERLQQLGMSTFSAIATLPVGIGALMGIEPAANALVAMNKEQSDREEYARLFGDEFGLGFQLVNTIPQVATDVLATIGTSGLYTAAKGVARGGAKAVTREALRGAMSMVDGATATLVKDAAVAGGESLVGAALKDAGVGLASKLARADSLVPLFATTFTRSASSTYGSVYGQLPEDMSADEKHRNAFGYAIAAGLSTAVITSGMSFLGSGGIEDLATGKFRPLTLADDTATNVRKVPLSELNYRQAKFLYENLENAGAKLADKQFQKVLRSHIGGEYKSYLRGVLKGGVSEGFEESLDTAIQMRIEDAALDKNTPLAERVNQIWSAFALGGILGGAHPAISQVAAPLQQSEISLALDARASVLTKVANDLRKTGSTATAEVLQRQLNDAQTAAAQQKQLEIAAQQQKMERAKFEDAVINNDKPISFDPTGQSELALADTRSMVLPAATRFLSDFEGERAYAGSYGGTIERDGDSVYLNLDEPRVDGVARIVVGNKFQPIDKSGVRLDRKRLMVTKEHNGSIPAGTPYMAPDPKRKENFALPAGAENVALVSDMADSPSLRIKGARMIGQENFVSDIIITDKGQIEDALRYYNLEFSELSKPENVQQLELGLFDETPDIIPATTPVADPTAVIETPVEPKKKGKKAKAVAAEPLEENPELTPSPLEVVADAVQVGATPTPVVRSAEEQFVADMIKVSPLSAALLELNRDNLSPERTNEIAATFKPEDFEDLQARINTAKSYALGLDDSLSGTRQEIFSSLNALQTIHTRVVEASFVPAKPRAAVVEQPATPEVTAVEQPVVPAPVAKAKKPVAAKKVPVTPQPNAIVVDNAEDPDEITAKLQAELSELATTVPVFDADGRTTTLESLEVELAQLDSRVSAAPKGTVPSGVIGYLGRLRDSVNQARDLVGEKAFTIDKQIKELNTPDPDVDVTTDEQKNLDDLLDVINGKPEVKVKKSTEKMGVGPVGFKPAVPPPIAVYKGGLFRNATEAQLYTEWVAGGFMITDLADYGYSAKSVSGIPFQAYSAQVKQRMFKDIVDQFPLIPTPEGTAFRSSKSKVSNMDGSGRSNIKIPVIEDTQKNPIAGVFTNDPIITMHQIDKGLQVIVPANVVKSEGFVLNPSIITDKMAGGALLVKRVRRHPNDSGVYEAGGISLVGKSGYTPKKVMASLGNLLREPAAQFLNGAGPSARNKADNSFETYMNDMMSVSSKGGGKGNYEERIEKAFYLQEDYARNAISEAQIAYANSLKEYGLGKRIESSLIKAQQLNPSTTLLDLDISGIILQEATTTKDKVTPPIENIAEAITKIYGSTAKSAEGELTNYGVYLYNKVTSGDMSRGVKPFEAQVFIYARRAEAAQGRRDVKQRGTGVLSQEEHDYLMASLADPNSDIQDYAIRMMRREALGQLTDFLRKDTDAYDLLFGVVSDKVPNLSEDTEESELINTAGEVLRNYQRAESVQLTRALSSSEKGLKLANLLIDADWLPPLRGEVVTPRQAQRIPTKVPPLAKGATMQQMADRVKLASKLVKESEGIYLSESNSRMLADAARKANNAEIKRLGLVSNNPESVIAALRDIQESGTPMQRLVAGVLTANVELIRNVRFVIGDMNDVRFAGAFMPKSNMVMVNLSGHNGRGVVDVLLHEYLHAATIQTMTNPTTPAQVAALQRITSLRNLTAAQAVKMGFKTEGFAAALEDNLEFITYALTAPEFQSFVRAATPTAQRSLLSRIWEALRSLFGYATTDKKLADAFDELLDFTQMFAGANTFNIRADRNLALDEDNIAEGLEALREFAKVRTQLRNDANVLLSETQPEKPASAEQILTEQLPKGFSARMNNNLKGVAGISRSEPTVLQFNEAYLNDAIDGLSESAAKARIRGLVNHEVAHFAALNSFTPAQIERVASELSEDQLQKAAEDYYATSGLTAEEIITNVVTDRESGVLSNARIADEWIRMQVEKAANGRTYEDIIKATKGNSTLLATVVDAIKAFVTKLSQQFTQYPSTETAAAISHAARALRKINKSKSIDFNADLYAAGGFGDMSNLFASLDGAPVEDQVSYAVPIASSNAGKVDEINKRLRLYNLPPELRDIINLRSGSVGQITTASKSLVKYFPKLRDNALKGGVDMEEIKLLFGTTAPPLTDADLKEVADLTAAYAETIPDTETEGRKADLAAEFSEKLKRERRLRFNEAFVKRQEAAEQSIKDAGFGELVDRAVLFRKDINKSKEDIGFDESNDVYLTRAYKFFNTKGWALAAKAGGILQIEGKEVDFDKLRQNAAVAYYEESEAEFQKLGKPYTSKDVDDLTLKKLDNYLSSLETMTASTDKATTDSIRKDLNRFKPKKDIDSTFRELLGEIEDPLANAVNTAFRVGMLLANDKFKANFAQTALDLGLASKVAKAGWVTSFAASSSKTTGELAGLYFDPKVAGVLSEMFGSNMNGLVSNSTGLMNGLGRAVMGVSGAAIQMKTQFGIGYWPRNVIGGYVLGAAQGILMNPFGRTGAEARTQARQAAFSSLGTEEEQRNAVLRLVQLNVLNDQSQGRVAQDLLRGLIATPEQDLQALMAAVDEARITKDIGGVMARIKDNGYLKGSLATAFSSYSKVTDALAALDGAIDGTFKANAYYYELGVIQKHFGDTMTVEAQEEAAARKVKLTFAGHSQVIDIVKSFNKTPMAAVFLPFARWKSEVFRTMLNTVPLAMEEIGQGGVMARRGVQRLAGFTATLTVAPVIIGTMMTTIFRALTGGEEEERELTAVELAALRESLPNWQRGHQVRAQVLKGGNVQMIDMSYILPHSQLTDAVNIITNGFQTGEGINGSRLASYVVNDLIGTQIAATSLDEILNNENSMGQPIYLETDNGAAKMGRMLEHYFKGAVTPSAVAKGMEFGRAGQTNKTEIFWGEILGSRPKTNTFAEIERRGFRNLKGLLDNSVSIVGDLTSGRFKSDGDIDDVIDRHQDALNETQRRMNRFMHSMVSMGSKESSVYASAKMYKFSDDTIGSAYQGYRIAWRPNEKWNQKTYFNAEQAKEQDPMQKIQSINRSVNRKGSVYYINGVYDE